MMEEMFGIWTVPVDPYDAMFGLDGVKTCEHQVRIVQFLYGGYGARAVIIHEKKFLEVPITSLTWKRG